MTFEEMQKAVYDYLRDYPRDFVEDSMVENWLNEGARDLAQRTGDLFVEDTALTVEAGGKVDLPADVVDLQQLRVGTDDVNFDVTNEEFWAAKDEGYAPSPPWGRIVGGQAEIYPAPVVGATTTLRYLRLPATMDAPTDVCELPVMLHDKVVLYATYKALYKEREDTLADRFFEDYERDLPQRRHAFGRQNKPKSFRYEANRFDLDPEAAHRG